MAPTITWQANCLQSYEQLHLSSGSWSCVFVLWSMWHAVLVVKNPPANAGDIRDAGSIPGLGRAPGGGHGSPPQYSCLENPMDRGAWRAAVHRVAKSQTWLKQLSMHTCMHTVFSNKQKYIFLFINTKWRELYLTIQRTLDNNHWTFKQKYTRLRS